MCGDCNPHLCPQAVPDTHAGMDTEGDGARLALLVKEEWLTFFGPATRTIFPDGMTRSIQELLRRCHRPRLRNRSTRYAVTVSPTTPIASCPSLLALPSGDVVNAEVASPSGATSCTIPALGTGMVAPGAR